MNGTIRAASGTPSSLIQLSSISTMNIVVLNFIVPDWNGCETILPRLYLIDCMFTAPRRSVAAFCPGLICCCPIRGESRMTSTSTVDVVLHVLPLCVKHYV